MSDHTSTQLQERTTAGLPRSGSYALQRRGHPATRSGDADHKLARALGWFSVGLGLTEVLAPRQLGRAIGLQDSSGVLRLLGLRELGNGLGILADPEPHPNWLNARVAGDMVDLALLGLALSSPSTERGKVAAATAAVACVTALDVLCAKQLQPRGAARSQNPAVLTATVAVNRPAHELYAFWRDPNRLSRVFEHVQVRASGDTRARWQLRGARGASWDWETELHSEVPGQRLAWRSVEGSQVQSDGTVEFLPLAEGRGTQVRVSLEYRLASGPVAAFARVFSALPGTVLRQELRRFKQLLETGEIPTTAGQPTGRRSVLSRRLP